jgi:hypothetical protein
MNFSTDQIKKERLDSMNNLRVLRHDFTIRHIPRLHRLLMEAFPWFRTYFKYAIAENEEDPMKLTLIRGKKVIARNFDYYGQLEGGSESTLQGIRSRTAV